MNNNIESVNINEKKYISPINEKFKEFREILDCKDEYYRNNISNN